MNNTMQNNRPKRPKRQMPLAQYGGQYRSAIGISTKDISDQQREQEALANFNEALQAAVTEQFGQPF